MDIFICVLSGIVVGLAALLFFGWTEARQRGKMERLQRESRWDWAVLHADRLTKSEVEIWKHLHTLENKVREMQHEKQTPKRKVR